MHVPCGDFKFQMHRAIGGSTDSAEPVRARRVSAYGDFASVSIT